jgi:hypothetical protein
MYNLIDPVTGSVEKVSINEPDIAATFARLQPVLEGAHAILRHFPAEGECRVNVPFCGAFVEAAPLARFLSASLGQNVVVEVDAVDILDHLLEEAKYSVAIAKDNRVRFVVDKMDVCKDRQAAAHLALGLHPATMGGAEWEQIIANVLLSRRSRKCSSI